jgi:Flp pilus assembly protein TadD
MESSTVKRFAAALAAAGALGACASTGGDAVESAARNAGPAHAQNQAGPARVDPEARARVVREDMLTQMAFWAAEYQTFPNDREAAEKFADTLRRGGRSDRAAQVAGEAAQRFPESAPLLMTLGLSQIAAGRPQEALRPLALVAASDAEDYRVRSALGAALDQVGRFADARRAYQEALAIRPDDPGVLTNLGMSHLLSGEPDEAEAVLRQAAALPGAPPETRQNLAIALALQGRFDEAERIERIDLPPSVVAENMSYLRGLTSDSRRWGDLGGNR